MSKVVISNLLGMQDGNVQPNPVKAAAGAQLKRFAVFVIPRHIVNVLGSNDCAKVLAFG